MIAAAEKSRVAEAFDLARDYDEHAVVQRHVAEMLADRIAALPIVAARGYRLRLLEIGCGTGLLTRALQDRGLSGHWLVTDIAPAMVARCAEQTQGRGEASLDFAVMDGERPAAAGTGFDVICSSMAFQWFGDGDGSLDRLGRILSPDGSLCFSTLLSGTFAEWEEAHARHGLRPAGLVYPDIEQLAALFPRGGSLALSELTERQRHANSAAFLHSLKLIGAGTPTAGRRPLPISSLRRVMASFDERGAYATYRIVLCHWNATKPPRPRIARPMTSHFRTTA